MEQVTCCLMFFKGDSITIDKHETTLSNKINNWRLEGLISISEKKSKVRHNSLLVTNQDPKAGLPLLIVYLLRKLNPLCCLGTLFLDSRWLRNLLFYSNLFNLSTDLFLNKSKILKYLLISLTINYLKVCITYNSIHCSKDYKKRQSETLIILVQTLKRGVSYAILCFRWTCHGFEIMPQLHFSG